MSALTCPKPDSGLSANHPISAVHGVSTYASDRCKAAVDDEFAALHEARVFRAEIDHAAAEFVRAGQAVDRVVDLDVLH